MRRVEPERDAACRTHAATGERSPPEEVAEFAGELPSEMAGENSLTGIESVAAHHIDRASEHKPYGDMALALFEHELAGVKFLAGPVAKRFAVSIWPASSTGNS